MKLITCISKKLLKLRNAANDGSLTAVSFISLATLTNLGDLVNYLKYVHHIFLPF